MAMIFNILDNTTELWMTKYIISEIFSTCGATLYKNPSDRTVSHRVSPIIFGPSKWKKNSVFLGSLLCVVYSGEIGFKSRNSALLREKN